jgi:hypothetical protein
VNKGKKYRDTNNVNDFRRCKTMSQISIQALDNGPFHVKGDTLLLDGEGKTMDTTSELYLCRCGLSKNSPYCDGSHQDKFKSEVRLK